MTIVPAAGADGASRTCHLCEPVVGIEDGAAVTHPPTCLCEAICGLVVDVEVGADG